MNSRRLKASILPRTVALTAAAAFALARGTDPSGETILRNVEARLASVRDYTVTLDIVADIERLNVPPMHATLYFKQPGKTHLDAEGFAMLPREGLQPDLTKLLARYTVSSVRPDTAGGAPVSTVTLEAKSDRTLPRVLAIAVDTRRWTAERIVTRGSADRVATIVYTYAQVEGVWLPSGMTATFALAPADTAEDSGLPAPARPPQKPRGGSVTVRFSDYRLNTGLSDDLFKNDAPAR